MSGYYVGNQMSRCVPLQRNCTMQATSRIKSIPHVSPSLVAVLVFLVSAIVFSQYGWKGLLVRDDAIFLYSGQQIARGIPPYVSAFDVKGPLSPLISGFGASVAKLLNFDDVLAVRITFFMISCLAVVMLYLLGYTLFESRRAGVLAAFIFIGFWCFGRFAMSGPRPKTPMVLFEILSLLLTARRKWFWAGICGSLAFLTWQPTVIYPLVTIFLAITQSERGRGRARNVIYAGSGALIPVIIVSLYFLYKGGFYEFVDVTILFNMRYLERIPSSPLEHIVRPIRAVYTGYATMMIPIILGILMVCIMYMWRIKLHEGSIPSLISKDRFAALLISFPAPILWSVLDFQDCPDFYVFLPYVAIGFGWLLCLALDQIAAKDIGLTVQKTYFLLLCVALVGSAAVYYRRTAENGLVKQYQWAQNVECLLGEDGKFVSIGLPEILVLLHMTNPNPYVYINGGIDNRINANTPGGFDGWLEELGRYDPSVIALGPTDGRFKGKLMNWLQTHYQETKVDERPLDYGGPILIMPWTLFVKSSAKEPVPL